MSALNSATKVRVFVKSADGAYILFGVYDYWDWLKTAQKLKVCTNFSQTYTSTVDKKTYYSTWELLQRHYVVKVNAEAPHGRETQEEWLYRVK